MAQTIQLRRSAVQGVSPTTAQLQLGELAINTYDGKVYIKKNNGTESIVQLNPLSTSDLSEGSNLYFTTGRVQAVVTKSYVEGLTIDYSSIANPPDSLQDFINDMWEVTSTVPTDGTGKPAGYVWYIV
jgi:hypothetical protein